jgi:hypothetical protein
MSVNNGKGNLFYENQPSIIMLFQFVREANFSSFIEFSAERESLGVLSHSGIL